ncbi:DNA repair-scaffolding protein-like isoform X2 [Halichondria panicea]|uniref:DNA repair-scaffolding protein-like isoform X2 n=1 Tax=Halichondria panicea TaxID=6063 RepID=UPI00312B7860
MPTSPDPCKLRGSLSVSSHLTSPVPDSSALTLSPVKSLLLMPAKDRHPTPLPTSTASSVQATNCLPEVPTLLLDAIEHAQCGMVGRVTGRVVRVYRRKRQQLIRTVQNDHKDKQPSTAQRTLSYSNKIRGSKFTWCLLLCDAAGLFSEIQLPQQLESEWSGLVETGEREVVHFTDLKLLRRANNTRSPELISSLKLYPPLSPLVSNSQTTFSAFLPSFCYILQASVTSLPLTASQGMGEKLPSLSRESQSPTRLDLLGRVLYYSQEYLKKEDSTHLQKLHSSNFGGYLHLLTPSALTPSPPTHPDPTLVTVYLKASFSIDGLEDTLSTPGAELLLRDVCRDSNGVAGLTIDACTDCPSNHVNEISKVVGVDEENAYSWPACDLCGNEQFSDNKSDSELHCDQCCS